MAKSTRPPVEIQKTLEDRVALLEANLAELRRQLTLQVRTRRLVIVNGAGDEWITAEANDRFATLRVGTPRVADRDHAADIFLQASSETEADVGLFLAVEGNAVGALNTNAVRSAQLTLDNPDGGDMTLDHGGLTFG